MDEGFQCELPENRVSTLLTVSSLLVVSLPTANATESSIHENSLSLLNEAIGIKTDLYATSQTPPKESLLMGITYNLYFAEAAIYRLDNVSGDYCLLAQAQAEINWTHQEWSTFSFGQAVPLQSGETYLVVLWSYQQDYDLWLASDTDYVNQYGFVYEAPWQNFEDHPSDFPTTLSGCYGGNSIRYSLYCPINPYPPP
jgi:hypothetical protein